MLNLQIIIFCLNRPILCDNLLQSIEKEIHQSKNFNITVLYGATSLEYEIGFDLLQKKYLNKNVTFVKKVKGKYRTKLFLLLRPRNLYYYLKFPYYRDSKNIFNFKYLLEKILTNSNNDYITFLTDDSFFYNKVNLTSNISDLIKTNPKQNSYSLRHGLNIRNLPHDLLITNNYLFWNYNNKKNDGHWSYRFSIDGHIYDRIFLLNFIKNILYINPNTFEGVVCRYAELRNIFKNAYSFESSVLAGAEINRVQNVHPNNNLNIDNEMLNKYYINGYKLQIIYEENSKDFRPEIKHLFLTKDNENIKLY
jgi:hypothetical protein